MGSLIAQGARALAIPVVAGIALWLGYWYVTGLQQDNSALQAAKAELEAAQMANAATIDELLRDRQQQAENERLLKRQLANASTYNDQLAAKLQRHDLTRLAAAKPQLIENRINAATLQVFEEISAITVTDDSADKH